MRDNKYIMESDEESFRLDIKVDPELIRRQANWAGLKPGMRVADLGCGPGNISTILHDMVQPGGSVVGVDGSIERLDYARNKYGREGIEFVNRNLAATLEDLGEFDFIWVRFVLEYYLSTNFEMVGNFVQCLKPGGILCLIDLDHNPLNHYGMSARLERTLGKMSDELQKRFGFDPYAGRKLYSFLYDLGFKDIDVSVENHRVTFGEVDELEVYNMMKKIEVVPKKINFNFDEYPGGYDELYQEVVEFLSDPRRFGYTPLILCRGSKPLVG
ncbi:MAG: methyltransferase domain-containing protein [Candidatus Marinimicrobia bacterium]|nr:methyltransferase domain-containing protein [Candidatus Neomarinimicrobiota bacterium]